MEIKVDDNRWIDLTIVLVETDKKDAAEIRIDERSGCRCIGSLLEDHLAYEFGEERKSNNLAITPYPYLRYGHFYSDLESRGLYIPNCNITGKKVLGTSVDGMFSYSVDNTKVGFSSFWYNDWKPVHPQDVQSLCGTYTLAEKSLRPEWWESEKQSDQLYVCKAKVLLSEGSHREFDSEVHEFCIPFGC